MAVTFQMAIPFNSKFGAGVPAPVSAQPQVVWALMLRAEYNHALWGTPALQDTLPYARVSTAPSCLPGTHLECHLPLGTEPAQFVSSTCLSC